MARGGSDRAIAGRLLRLLRPYRLRVAGIVLLTLLASPLALLTPLPLKLVVDSVLGAHPLPGLVDALLPRAMPRTDGALLALAAGLLLGTALVGRLLELATALLRTSTGERLVLDLRAQLFAHAQRLSLAYHDARGTADTAYRLQYDASAVQNVTIDSVAPLAGAVVSLGAMLLVAARLDWQLALVAMAVAPPLFWLSRIWRRRLRRQATEAKRLESQALAVVQEVLGAARVVKAFGQEDRESARFVRQGAEGLRARVHLALAEGLFSLLVGLLVAAGTAAVLVVGTAHVHAGRLTLGELLLVLGYLAQLYEPLKTISRKAASLQLHLAGAERAFALLDEPLEVPQRPDPLPLARARGAVAFEDVSFAYGADRPVLRHVSFAVAPGTRVGLAGTTGAGKSTIVQLLARLYDPTSGRVLLDGVDLRDYRLEELRRQFAVVPQEPVLFSTTVAENIAYARPGASREEIAQAARAANAHAFIEQLPQGYDTPVGERGQCLSGGERQRISLARAFLADAPLLILDEPTSAVDPATEAAIVEATERLSRGRTTFLVAHRPSTLAPCDLLLVVERGRLAEVRRTERAEGTLLSLVREEHQ